MNVVAIWKMVRLILWRNNDENVGFVWMLLSQSSTGPFMVLAGAGGALLANGRRKEDK